MRYTSLIGLFCAGLFLNASANAQGPSGVVRIGILNDQSGPYATADHHTRTAALANAAAGRQRGHPADAGRNRQPQGTGRRARCSRMEGAARVPTWPWRAAGHHRRPHAELAAHEPRFKRRYTGPPALGGSFLLHCYGQAGFMRNPVRAFGRGGLCAPGPSPQAVAAQHGEESTSA